jgi:hypothetical protein
MTQGYSVRFFYSGCEQPIFLACSSFFIIWHEEYLLIALSDSGSINSSINLEAYNSDPFIKTDDSITTIWSKIGGKSTTNKTGI